MDIFYVEWQPESEKLTYTQHGVLWKENSILTHGRSAGKLVWNCDLQTSCILSIDEHVDTADSAADALYSADVGCIT